MAELEDKNDAIEINSNNSVEDRFIELDQHMQSVAGIKTTQLTRVFKRPEIRALAHIQDIALLLNLRAAYRNAMANRNIAAASLQSSSASFERLRDLKDQNAASIKQYQAAKALWLSDKAQATAKDLEMQNIGDQIRLQWGSKIAEWIAAPTQNQVLQKLLNQELSLVLVSLPRDQQLSESVEEIYLSKSGKRGEAQSAQRISAATSTDPTSQGETWYFVTDNIGLRSGMVLDAWIPQSEQSEQLFNIPLSAIVWYSGKPWIYLQTEQERFHRETLSQYLDDGDAWLVKTDQLKLENGENIVVQGAQLLLSEENRFLIPEEDDDDDDAPGDMDDD